MTRINYFEGSDCFNTERTPLKANLGDILAALRTQYNYRPTTETLWAEIFNSECTARVQYVPETDSLQAITFVTVQNFYDYCIALGIKDAACKDCGEYFSCFTKSTRMNSHIAAQFSEWSDVRNAANEYTGYEFKLRKLDIHNFSHFNFSI